MTDQRVDLALRLLADVAVVVVGGADGASVAIERNDRLQTVAASNETVRRMDDHQYATGEGPCLSAAAEGRLVVSHALSSEARWPAFVPQAIDEGIASILSVPLMADEHSVGSLNIWSSRMATFGERQRESATGLADLAAALVVEVRDDPQHLDAKERITAGLEGRAIIAQAQGVLMSIEHLTAEEAGAALIRSARSVDQSVLEWASGLVASTARTHGTTSDETATGEGGGHDLRG